MKTIRERFEEIEDKRHGGYIEYNLAEVLILVLGAVLCGITALCDMMVYFENKLSFYTQHYGIEKYPSKPTLSRILNMIEGEKVAQIIVEIMRDSANELDKIVAVDGKAIRCTGKAGKPHSALQILTAYVTGSGVVLGQKAISEGDKTNEIPVFQEMLEHINIEGKTITADAMHCQKETCAKIIKNKGDYAFGLKGNQGSLFNDVKLFLEDSINSDAITIYRTLLEKSSGRVTQRICSATGEISWIPGLSEWQGLKRIFSVKRIVTKQGKTATESSYYITSLAPNPENLLKITREHWKIESMHWMLDVIWDEDTSGLLSENGNKTINAFRKLALLAHKKYLTSLPTKKKPSVKGNVLATSLNDSVLAAVIEFL
jgi:predicted transposase YbfD/YdcC